MSSSSRRRSPTSGCHGGFQLLRIPGTGGFTPRDRQRLRKTLRLLLLLRVTGAPTGVATIVAEVVTTDGLPRHTMDNPFVVQRPEFVQQVVVEENDPARSSLLVVDNRDERIISPFQNWLVEEIISNAASSINDLTERDQVMPPNSGYNCSVRCSRTTRSMASRQFCCSRCPLGVGLPCEQGSLTPCFSSFYVAGHVRHLGHLCGREGLQWQ